MLLYNTDHTRAAGGPHPLDVNLFAAPLQLNPPKGAAGNALVTWKGTGSSTLFTFMPQSTGIPGQLVPRRLFVFISKTLWH